MYMLDVTSKEFVSERSLGNQEGAFSLQVIDVFCLNTIGNSSKVFGQDNVVLKLEWWKEG